MGFAPHSSSFISPLYSWTSPRSVAEPRTETVVVTGTYEPMSLEEIDRAIRVLPARSESLVLNTLSDLLKLDPSLDLEERAPNGVQTDLSIRGAGFGKTLVLLNGMRLNDVQSGHHNMDIPVPLDSVSRIEVMRGSGSTLYGSDAIGGVVNIITEPPPATEFRLRTAVGSDGINQQSGAHQYRRQETLRADRLRARFLHRLPPDRDYRNLQFASVTRIATSIGNGSINLAYMDHPFGADQFYGNYNSWEDTKTWFAGVQQALGEKTSASFSFRRHSDLFVLYRDQPDIFTNHHSDESYQLALRRREEMSTATTLYYGVEGFHESVISNNLGDHSRCRVAAYGAADFRALHRFSRHDLRARRDLPQFLRRVHADDCRRILGVGAGEIARLRQPRFPRAQLHRPLLSRPGQYRQSEPAAGARLDLRRRRRLDAERCAARRHHVLRAP